MSDTPTAPGEPEQTPQYKPGDIANGHVLGSDNQWHPVVGVPAVAALKKGDHPRSLRPVKIGVGVAAALLALVIIIGTVNNENDPKPPAAAGTGTPATAEESPVPEPEVEKVVVPDVTGMDVVTAEGILSDAGFRVDGTDDPTAIVLFTTPSKGSMAEQSSTVTLTVKSKPKLTLSQENAVAKAQSYLDTMAFSRGDLIDQLVYNQFSVEDATFAVDYIDADWNEQAAKKAQSYLDTMAFSRQDLYDQLIYNQFTDAQAKAGLAAVGY